MKRSFIIVDVQNDYFPDGKMELVGMQAAAEKARYALDLFRKKKTPIFHIQHLSSRPGATFFLPGTQGAEINDSVTPQRGESIIPKHFPNAFRDTALQEQLQRLEVEEVIICGAMTHMCIDTTVRAAFDLGFRCLVLSDACATKDMAYGGVAVKAQQVQAAFMAALAVPFAHIINVNELEGHLG